MNGRQNHNFTSLKDIQRMLEYKERENFSRKFGRSGYGLDMFYSSCGVRIIGVKNNKTPTKPLERWRY